VWDEADLAPSGGHYGSSSSHASRVVVGRRVGERDAAFEFFALTLLCVKLHSGIKDDGLYTLRTQDLWQKAQEAHVPFHKYYAWLEDQIHMAYVSNKMMMRNNRLRADESDAATAAAGPQSQATQANGTSNDKDADQTTAVTDAAAAAAAAPTLNTAALRLAESSPPPPSIVAAAAAPTPNGAAGGGDEDVAASSSAPAPHGVAAALQRVPLSPDRAATAAASSAATADHPAEAD
jgi:hypothetical protein